MLYYEVALLKSPLENLTFESDEDLQIGTLVEVSLKNRKNLASAVLIKKVQKPDFKCTKISEVSSSYYDEKMLLLAQFISKYYVCSLGEALSVFLPFDKNISKISKQKYFESGIELSSSQKKAYDFLEEKRQALLFAITGSGKTEIYIKSIEKYLNQGKQALLLMPEISLSPQMQKRLEKVFDKSVAIWHSKVSKKKKNEILQGLQQGSIKLIAGARSALFLPFENLGIIVVDEEHDDSYKSDQKPRLNAKDLSVYMAKKFDLPLILGSATPSVSSFDKIPCFKLFETFYDTSKKYTFVNSSSSIAPEVLQKIANTLEQNAQVIVFLPTRANFKYQICTSCGKSVECPFCSVSMSLHKNDLALKCHYCGYAQAIPNSCPSCSSGIIKNLRVGTAQVEEILKENFPNKTIKRFDRDNIKTNKQLKDILTEFNDAKIDILVGTQMLSKGHDYHNVKLAVVLGIDSVLAMNSYRSWEKAFSLLLQIAGRAGRKGQGEVIIQSKNEELLEFYLKDNKYDELLTEELETRAGLYPPSVKLAKIVFSHTNGLKVKDEFDKYIKFLQGQKDIQVVGFGQSVIFKIANKYRYEILLRSKNIKALLGVLHSIKSPMASIDMDTLV